ncbi:MAG TPA: DUF2252 family protein [Rhizobacter sp.]|nr:DUF2252 family protein [Rhizobacter sp.]
MNPVQAIQAYNAGREPERLQLKYRKMRESPFVFLRGTCHLFYARLPSGGVFRSAPPVWSCGDLHIENFGSYKGDNRLSYFDTNDYDEAALAPASWDLVRVLCSLWVAADSGALGAAKPSDAKALAQTLLRSFAASLAHGKAYWVERDTAQGPVKTLLDDLRKRERKAFLDDRTQRKPGRPRKLRIDGEKTLAVDADQHKQVEKFMKGFASQQPDPDFYKLLDVARRIAGTGSLGVERYVLLVRGKGSPDGNYLLDLKRSLPSSLVPHLRVKQPRWDNEAERIVTLQQRMQAVPMALLHPVTMNRHSWVLRELQPTQDRVALDKLGRDGKKLELLVTALGQLIAWAQLRSAGRQGSASADELIDYGQRKRWQARLLEAAREGAKQVERDARSFNAAYDDGVFGPHK